MPVPGTAPYRGAWQKTVRAAEEANEPGRFTAFIGFEWTSNTGGNNLHRNVVFRDDATKALQVEPYTTMKPLGSDNPVDLWKWMTAFEQKTGGDVLAIAHNGNLSNGEMFPMVEAFGKKIDRAYADERAKWERLYEVTQTKGTGEAHPFLSPNDEFADYELWDKGNLDGSVAKKKPQSAPEDEGAGKPAARPGRSDRDRAGCAGRLPPFGAARGGDAPGGANGRGKGVALHAHSRLSTSNPQSIRHRDRSPAPSFLHAASGRGV